MSKNLAKYYFQMPILANVFDYFPAKVVWHKFQYSPVNIGCIASLGVNGLKTLIYITMAALKHSFSLMFVTTYILYM